MSHAPSASLEQRHAAIRFAMADQHLDALIVTALPNILYLTNFTGSSAIVIVTAEDIHFVTDSRYVTVVSDTQSTPYACPELRVTVVESSYDETLATLLGSGRVGSAIGFEGAHLSVARHAWLLERLKDDAALGLVSTEGIIERARIKKDAYEQAALRESARRLSNAANALLEQIRPGRTEREVAGLIESLLRDAGFERPAFETIVAAGPNAALPHARPGERRLSEGDLVVLDFGGVYDSYCSDLTRTVVVGKASARSREVYQAVLDAHDQAIAAVRPGVMPFVVDQAARDLLTARGMGEAFGHGTGHGLGIEVHEEPRVSRRRTSATAGELDEVAAGVVTPGMVFTIEPGAYFPGWGGVRIEDDVLVTEDGVEVLTTVPTALVEI